MKRLDLRILIGALLIGVGLLFLLQTFNLITNVWSILWTIAFLIGSGIFFYIYFTDRKQWWALIPAITLLGLATTIFVDYYFPNLSNMGGAILLGGIGLGFWMIYLTNREYWWAIIPGGVLLTLGFVTFVDDYIEGDNGGGIFFIGLAISFLLLGVLGKPRENFWWAYIPAGVLLILGVFLIDPLQTVFNYIWPAVLILGGGFLLIKNLRKS